MRNICRIFIIFIVLSQKLIQSKVISCFQFISLTLSAIPWHFRLYFNYLSEANSIALTVGIKFIVNRHNGCGCVVYALHWKPSRKHTRLDIFHRFNGKLNWCFTVVLVFVYFFFINPFYLDPHNYRHVYSGYR